LAFRKATGLVKASCLCGVIGICSTRNQDLSRNEDVKPGPTAFFQVGQNEKNPEDIPSHTTELLMSNNWDYSFTFYS